MIDGCEVGGMNLKRDRRLDWIGFFSEHHDRACTSAAIHIPFLSITV